MVRQTVYAWSEDEDRQRYHQWSRRAAAYCSSQDQADTLKHFQDNIIQFLRDRTNLTEDQLDNKIFKRDWWMTGQEAIELGIATGSI